jgi:amidase
MLPDDIHYASLIEVARLIAAHEISPVELTEAMLQRIAAVDPKLHGFMTVTSELALQQARQAETEIMAGRYRGVMHGIPVAAKDLCFTKGIRTTGGMRIYDQFVPDYDATVITRLANAGAVLVGKLHMTEGAMFEHHDDYPQPINPWNSELWTGVSSSGSGITTAAGLNYASIGSDTGGSIRFPTAANGLTGIKPTWGLISRYGIFDLAASFDHLGPMARSAADAGAMLQALAGYDPQDPTSLTAPVPDYLAMLKGVYGARDVRIGIDWSYVGEDTEAQTLAGVTEAAATLMALGAREVPIAFPSVKTLIPAGMQLMMAEIMAVHAPTYPERAADYGTVFREALRLNSAELTPADIGRGQIEREKFRGALNAIFEEVDIVLTPVFRKGTPTWDELRAFLAANDIYSLSSFTLPFNCSGHPTITLPCGYGAANQPIALQLVGRRGGEAQLLRVAHAYQQATDWHLRRPPLN